MTAPIDTRALPLQGATPAGGSAEREWRHGATLATLQRARRAFRWTAVAMVAAAAAVPLLGSDFYTRLATEALLLAMLALSVDLLLGFAGLLSLGQAAWFGVGAYLSAWCTLHLGLPLPLTLLVVLAAVSALALALGATLTRSAGVYFALVTFGIGEVLGRIVANSPALGGHDGLLGIHAPAIDLGGVVLDLAAPTTLLYTVAALVGATLVALRRLLCTPFGAALEGLHDNEARLPYLGHSPARLRLAVYVVAANVAALGGAFYPLLRGLVSPALFGFEASAKAVVMALVGGLGTLLGPVLGAVVVTGFETVVGNLTRFHLVAVGLLFVACVLFLPGGLARALRPAARR